jgi:hypothetical protein
VTTIEVELGASASIVTVDYVNGSASVVQATAPAGQQGPPEVENRAEAVMDVATTAQTVVSVYRDALTRLADQ